MMEVKHSPNVPLLDYVSTNSDSNSAETSALLNSSSASSKMQATKLNDELLQNGKNIEDELDFHDAIDDTELINSDLEDALLADDDLLAEPKTNFSLENLDKAENSTDPGDDLDKLLSKINDVVEGSDLTGSLEIKANKNETKECEQVNGTQIQEEENLEESIDEVIEVSEKKMSDIEAMEIDEEKVQPTEDIEDDILMMEKEISGELATELSEKPAVESYTTKDKKLEESKIQKDVKESKMEIEEQQEEPAITSELSTELSAENKIEQLENKTENDEKNKREMQIESEEMPRNIVSETEHGKDKHKAATEDSLEEGEILDEVETETKNQSESEIFTLVLDDDDDDDVVNESEISAKKANKPDKKINEDEEIVCLDDDDEDEVPSATTNEAESSVTQVGPSKSSFAEKTEEPIPEDVSKANGSEAKAKESRVSGKDLELKSSKTKTDDNVIDAEGNVSVVETENKSPENRGQPITDPGNKSSESKFKSKDTEINTQNNDSIVEDVIKVSTENESKESESASKSQDESASKQHESETPVEKQTEKPNNLISDNTDNACDGLEGTNANEKGAEEEESIKPLEDDARSETSSGSNLLQEGQAPSESAFELRDDADEEDEVAECEVEDGDDVVMLEGEVTKATDNECKVSDDDIELPPAKKLRLSTDSDSNNENKNNEENLSDKSDKTETQLKSVVEQKEEIVQLNEPEEKMEVVDEAKNDGKDIVTKAMKRAFTEAVAESEESNKNDVENESVTECSFKKPKTVTTETAELTEAKSEQKPEEKSVLEKLLKQTDISKATTEDISDVKQEPHTAVPSNKPIPLYPPPKFEETPKKLSLDFLQRFRKTFNQMTKNDLEELVLQKVVEALVYENQFADLRLIIEKQEKVIALHRSKLAQLVKQYRDLEMVHTRVVKDMREKNSQYLMPVRITRAVGLQVSSPSVRKLDGPNAQTAPSNAAANAPNAAGIMRAPQSIQQQAQQQQQKRLASPQRPQAGNSMLSSSSTSTPTSPVAAAAAATPNATQPVRRGCMQKVTAQRPVNGTNVSPNPPMASIPASSYSRTTMSKAAPSTTAVAENTLTNSSRILNKNAPASTNSRARYSGGNVNSPSPVQQAQQAKSPPQIVVRQAVTANNASKINASVQNKITQQTQFRRSDASPTMGGAANTSKSNTSATYMEQYKNSFNQAMPTVSITPARPKDKSVIDLTDEDDVPTPSPPIMSRARVTPQTQLNASTPNANNRQSMPPALTRIPSGVSVRPQITPRQLSTMQSQKNSNAVPQQSTTITTPNGMSITRVAVNQANPATQRLRYTHPAALPPTPPQAYNPSWKLPPPRPTIRISNLENGIVISWTMEEALDRHAEVTTYQIYAYQETNAPPSTDSWRHVGDVKAMLLPMAVTLTQFQEDQRYFFSVRAMDAHQRYGPFSSPKTWNST